VTCKYGKVLKEAFNQGEEGKMLKKWVNSVDNNAYSALTFQGGTAFRKRMLKDVPEPLHGLNNPNPNMLKDVPEPIFDTFLQRYDDEELFRLVTNLGGHCMETVLEV